MSGNLPKKSGKSQGILLSGINFQLNFCGITSNDSFMSFLDNSYGDYIEIS